MRQSLTNIFGRTKNQLISSLALRCESVVLVSVHRSENLSKWFEFALRLSTPNALADFRRLVRRRSITPLRFNRLQDTLGAKLGRFCQCLTTFLCYLVLPFLEFGFQNLVLNSLFHWPPEVIMLHYHIDVLVWRSLLAHYLDLFLL